MSVSQKGALYRSRTTIELNYEVDVLDNPRLVHKKAIRTKIGKPSGRLDEEMIKHPAWSTCARYKINISDKVVRTYVNEIVSYGFNNSHVEMVIKRSVTVIMNYLKSKGFLATLWIHPFINKGCDPSFSGALKNGYFR
ncbi:myogenesis-regulating glycosidase-like [Cephus cinctus]|uniref:Myogenesis-regulating glycosidase-like n=1 Tax=Cephus cinctus TaxID=211228 RepID=A0AAJ7RGK9_CEPCN|nr:myogenesis-regulating glycosidase-like [Cephus cinctus]